MDIQILPVIKSIYDKPTIILNSKIRNKTRMPNIPTVIQHSTESPSQNN